jgi:alpha-galactosidase
LTAGWYGNNCICSDHSSGDRKFYEGDAKALRNFNFDGFKLDGCGAQTDMQLWDDVFKADGGAPVMVENCHWGSKKPYEPTADWCPWNFYRTSGDVRARFSSVMGNLNSVTKFSDRNLSYPGCWAYPDMLEVGCQHGPGGSGDPGLSMEETRTHFGAWAIVSSPLTLSHDVNNDTIMDQVWDVISNKEAIEVSQTYAGFSGGVFKESSEMVKLDDVSYAKAERGMAEHELLSTGPMIAPAHTFLYKPMTWDRSRTAVMLINSDASTQTLTFNLSDVPGLTGPCDVRDIWAHKDLGNQATSFTHEVASHDSMFLMLSGCTPAPLPPKPKASKIVNPASNRCMEILHGDFSNEAQVTIHDCGSGDQQEWLIKDDSTIVNPASGKCLDINNKDSLSPDQYKDETKVELYSCNGNPNQKWELQGGQLVNPPSGKCLDIYSPSGALENDTPLQLFTCSSGKKNQQWEIQQEFLV